MTYKHCLIKAPKKTFGYVGKIWSFPNSPIKVLIELGNKDHPISRLAETGTSALKSNVC